MCRHSQGRFRVTQKRINFIMMLKAFMKNEVQHRVSGRNEEKRERESKGQNKIRQDGVLGLEKIVI